jgi:hypothetical protein
MNLALGLRLALNVRAINKGGSLVPHLYTSHMTGFASHCSTAWCGAMPPCR